MRILALAAAIGLTMSTSAIAAPKWAIVVHGGAGVIERSHWHIFRRRRRDIAGLRRQKVRRAQHEQYQRRRGHQIAHDRQAAV